MVRHIKFLFFLLLTLSSNYNIVAMQSDEPGNQQKMSNYGQLDPRIMGKVFINKRVKDLRKESAETLNLPSTRYPKEVKSVEQKKS